MSHEQVPVITDRQMPVDSWLKRGERSQPEPKIDRDTEQGIRTLNGTLQPQASFSAKASMQAGTEVAKPTFVASLRPVATGIRTPIAAVIVDASLRVAAAPTYGFPNAAASGQRTQRLSATTTGWEIRVFIGATGRGNAESHRPS